MIDCPDGEIRDQLPDLVHERLDRAAEERVAAHVAGCSACAADVTLLRELRDRLRAGAAVDVSRIVAALPVPAASPRRSGGSGWRTNWRVAAGMVAVVLGGGTAVVVGRTGADSDRLGSGAAERSQRPVAAAEQRVASVDLSIDADLAEASTVELEALLRDLETFDGLPAGEPESLLPNAGNSGLDE